MGAPRGITLVSVSVRTRNDDARTLEALVRRDRAIPGFDVLLSAATLSDALGEPVRITRVRYKPGASVVVAFDGAAGSQWAAAYRSDDKPAKTLAHAARRGLEARRIPGVPCSVVASAFADRALWAPLKAWQKAMPAVLAQATLFRHNPQRRMLFEVAGRFVKLAADPHRTGVAVQRALAARGLPVLAPTVLAAGVSATPRWGFADLGMHRSTEHAAAAGAALAGVHRTPVTDERSGARAAGRAERDAAAAVTAVGAIVPGLADRARRLAEATVPTQPAVLLHGDFTADQVLVGDGIRLIDFDRSEWGPPARDLGCFLAGELLETGDATLAHALLDGYRRAGGDVDASAVRAWGARCLLLRAIEPFRRAQPGWTAAMERALTCAEELQS